MLIALRWLLRFVFAALILLAIGVMGALWFAKRSLPQYTAQFEQQGIKAPVEIVRDNANIPHIFGANDDDVYYALGFAHAQDRLWQMTLLRRTAQGRLSEIFGARTLETDMLLRRYDLYTLAQKSVNAQDPETQAALSAYARGVNAWIREVSKGTKGRGAPEFFVFPSDIAAWSPADSIAIIKLMALQLSRHMQQEVLQARLALLLPPERFKDLFPEAMPVDFKGMFPQITPKSAALHLDYGPHGAPNFSGASNAWVAAGKRTAAGAPLLANDPHLGFSAPALWYLARLDLQSGSIIGATIPGTPAVFLGRSANLGWGLTSAYLDDQDIVIERVNPDNPKEYQTAAGWRKFTTRRSIINVKDAAPVTITLRWSESGPILPAEAFDLTSITPTGHVAALSWTALSPADTSMSAAMRLMRSQNIDQALAAGSLFIAPAQNLFLASKDEIAQQLIGVQPGRDATHPTKGQLPALGSHPATRWTGTLPYERNPRVRNPEAGLLGNTNNKLIGTGEFPNHISFTWGDTQRITRWKTLMESREIHSRESFIEAQLDAVSPVMRMLLPLAGADLWFTGQAAPEGTQERLRQRALGLIAAWNGEMDRNLPEPLIASAWLRALQDRLIRDELGPLAAQFTHIEPEFIARVLRNTDSAGIWCDIATSRKIESCHEQISAALDDALLILSEKYGGLPESWRWGDAHQALHDHSTLGKIPLLNWLVNIRQPISGGDFTLQRSKSIGGSSEDPYNSVQGAGYRGVYDFADPESSLFIIATGQSGHPLSPHYDDLSKRWIAGDYIPMSLDPELARAGATGITTLTPQ